MNEKNLAEKRCIPCTIGAPPLSQGEQESLLQQLETGWRVVSGHHLEREFRFEDFKDALGFVNRVGELAESVGHHPDLLLAWGKVGVTIWTHKIDGLTESDFVLAAKIEKLPR